MNRPRRRRKSSRSEAATEQISFPQLDRQVLRNRFAPVEPLDDEQMALIHEATMTLLEDQGIEVLGDMALDVLRRGGAEVDDKGTVTIDRALLMETIGKYTAGW